MTSAEIVAEVREVLKGWGRYGLLREDADCIMYGWQPLPVDDMTDAEVMEAARRIAQESSL